MRHLTRTVLAAAVLALGLLPGGALADVEYQPEPPKHQHPDHQPKGHAYGYYCKGESKKHVEGTPGTPFSQCVKAHSRADHNENVTARKACKAMSKKHVRGEKGTAFSRCIKSVNQMRREQREREAEEAQS
ncbi:MAG TPA: hypothetical protein VFJ99_05905 [Solirubrobacterales bacterium]|nr:hypothetical protein [Solirubrobacterales bacterium]